MIFELLVGDLIEVALLIDGSHRLFFQSATVRVVPDALRWSAAFR